MGVREWLERRRQELFEFNRQRAVRRRQERRELQRGKTEVEQFYSDYEFHTGLDLSIPANKEKASIAMLEYFLTRGEDGESGPKHDGGSLMDGF
ncbi:MAG: hypothetical protein WBW31_23760 [Candidatus Sulfotelmatobacter sp.]